MYVRGEWPDFLYSVIISDNFSLEIQRGAQDCRSQKFRTISLVSHASKIVLKILAHRLESTAESYLGKEQFGYRKCRGTRDATAALRVSCERNVEYKSMSATLMTDF